MTRSDFPRGNPVQRFTTKNGLLFEESNHFKTYGLNDGYPWKNFRVGTVEGLFCQKDCEYHILAIQNTEPHNGHLSDLFEWFFHSCRRDRMPLIVHEVGNPMMARVLLRLNFLPMVGTNNFKWTP